MIARSLAPLVLAALVLPAAPRAAPARAPWDGPALLGDPKEILAAAQALPPPPGAEVDVLLEEGLYRIDARGAATFTYRTVFRALGPEAARSWARISVPWSPWHQARPEIRARVITPDGAAHLLDPATLAESGLRDADRDLYTDRKVLEGPLPAIRPGAIVEEVITLRDSAPFFEAGSVYRFFLGGSAPTRLARFRVEAPADAPLAHVVRGTDARARVTVEKGVRIVAVELRDARPVPPPEPFGPPDLAPAPYVAFSTGRSWADVAARYGAVLDRQLAGADLRAAADAARAGAKERREIVKRVVAWVHDNVRYTGLELGEAAVVPAPPAETLRRRYGDCKDLSLLVTGLLRAAGLDARVVLVRTDWNDLDPELPGFGAFDHAVVRVEGEAPIWIDATDPATPPGLLPPPVQGKLALVVPDGKALLRTPESPAAENRLRITRELRLAELGPGAIVETREATGAFAAQERALRGGLSAAQRREAEERYAKEAFHAERHVATKVAGLDDPSSAVTVTVEVEGSKVALTADDAAEVPVTPEGLFEGLPPPLSPRAEAPPRRRTDLVLPLAFRSEVRYRVIPPEGFRARPAPEGATRTFGPATLARTAALEKDGSVTVSWTLDTGGRRLAAADADALAAEVRRLAKERPLTVKLERTGAALLAAGKVPEAIAEMRRLAALHPAEATHHLHLALALLGLGFQEEAAAEARRAIALEPERAWGHRVLGWILSHDVVGRLHGPGFDREGAIAACRKAKELEPTHASGRAALASLLATDRDGARVGPGPGLDEAIAEFRAIRDELRDRSHDAGLLEAYFAAGRHDDAITLARELDRSEGRDAVLLASIAARDGAEIAISDAERLGDDRRKALQAASGMLVQVRRYELASALAAAAASGAPNAAALRAQADTLADVRRHETLLDEGDAPTRIVRRFFHALYVAPDPAKALVGLVSERGAGSPGAPADAAEELPAEASMVRRYVREAGAPPAVLLDLTLARLSTAVDGDEKLGYRVRVQFPFGQGDRGATLFLVPEKKGLKILATEALLPVVGAEVLRRLDAGDLAGARRWMDWARAELPSGEGEDATPSAVVGGLARGAGTDVDAAALRRAAAALLAYGDRTGPAIPILEKARAAEKDPSTRRLLGLALVQAYRGADRPADLLKIADELLADDPGSRAAFVAKLLALQRLKRPGEARAAADAILRHRPEDPGVLRALASTEMTAGELDRAAAAWKRLLDTGRAQPMDYNNAAWLELFRADAPPKHALEWSRRATEGARGGNDASLNTLAAIYAALGKPGEAREVFLQSLRSAGVRGMEPSDWLVFGWIAEGWGLADVAAAAYRKVVPEKTPDGETDFVGPDVLARRRLAKLGAAAQAKPVPAVRP